MGMHATYAAIRENRRTDAAKACVDLAEGLFASGEDESSKEARQWIAPALQADKASADADIEDLKRRAAEKTKTRDLAARAKAVGLAVVAKDSV